MTKGLGKGVYYNLESGHDLLGPPYSIINLWFTTCLLSSREMATVKGHSNAECEKSRNNMAGETMKANTNCRLFFTFLFRKNFDQNSKEATPNACFMFHMWNQLGSGTHSASPKCKLGRGVWMGDRNGLWTQIKKCSLKLVDFNVLYKLTRSQNLISLNILH